MKTEILNDIYNLVLSRHIRDFERGLLLAAKADIEAGQPLGKALSKLEADLRPLALRRNLTPMVNDFYKKITSQSGLFGRGAGAVTPKW
ncbi:bacteriocin immunity protein [Lactococcus termiticola]|uniref:Uncharacterized protein n=1 Tax=Lactococcus termiticola TaxID=2169526 RepID=A0A2R5HFU9_9LACT|nr:bacteriocin immunity protein [Lactococcus termiticola]GBG96943.1 hypothetical protein NtB2_01079 [Lactococcus termiticola]